MALRFLALGDSYTVGEGVRPNERWLYQLAAALRRDGWDIELPPALVARTGCTTIDLLAAFDTADLHPPYDLVTIHIGANDQRQGVPIDEFRASYGALLARARVLAGEEPSRVVAVSLPDWGVTPFAAGLDRAEIALEIDAFNAEISTLARRNGMGYSDITRSTRDAGSALGMLISDGLHPSKFQYGEWARVARPAVVAALGNRRA